MKKKLVASLAAAMVLGVAGTSFAAVNAFSDVQKGHWSYDAVNQLQKDGIVEGTGDGKFYGDRPISRYEMAIIVAKAMSKTDKAIDAKDKALITKLTAEYGSELDKLGARVSTLETKVDGGVKFGGFLRARYDSDSRTAKGATVSSNANGGNKHYLLVLDGNVKVNDQWKVNFANEVRYGYTQNNTSWGMGGNGGALFRAWAEGTVGGVNVALGRKWFGYGDCGFVGQESTGIWLSGGKEINTSVFLAKPSNSVGMGANAVETALYGVNFNGNITPNLNVNLLVGGNKKDYAGGTLSMSSWQQLAVGYQVSPDVKVSASYGKTNALNFNKRVHAEIDYKGANGTVGSYGLYARYFNFQANGAPAADDQWGSVLNDSKGWIVGYNTTVAKNVAWETLYSQQTMGNSTNADVKRKLFRTQVQFNF